MRQGGRAADDQAMAEVYDEFRRIASREMRREGPGYTLQTSARQESGAEVRRASSAR